MHANRMHHALLSGMVRLGLRHLLLLLFSGCALTHLHSWPDMSRAGTLGTWMTTWLCCGGFGGARFPTLICATAMGPMTASGAPMPPH